MPGIDLDALLEDVSGLAQGALREKGSRLYRQLYLNRGRFGVHQTHDAQTLLFHEDRFDHAFQTSSDPLVAPDSKDLLDPDRIARIRWIGPVVRGTTGGTACFEVPGPTGRSTPPNRLYVVYAEYYVVWLEPRTRGGWRFSSAYTATREQINRYQRGGRTVGRW